MLIRKTTHFLYHYCIMNRLLLTVLFLFTTNALFAQKEADTLLARLPMFNGRLVYADTVRVEGHSKALLDTTAKRWFNGYFKLHRPDTLAAELDPASSVLSQCAMVFRISSNPHGIKYNFYLVVKVKINTGDGYYSYKIFDIFFLPKSQFVRGFAIYQTSPEYLIGQLTAEHRGLVISINLGKTKIREYLTDTDKLVRACIASLNKAMSN